MSIREAFLARAVTAVLAGAAMLPPLTCQSATNAPPSLPGNGAPGTQRSATSQEHSASQDVAKPQGSSTRRLPRADRRRGQSSTTAVHKAWLKEIIDLDRPAAIAAYDDILKTSAPEQPDRWIAVARLRELGRLGVLRPEPLATPGQEPADVKQALDRLNTPFPVEDVLQNPDSGEEIPALRPATPMVQDWVRDQIGLTMQERYRSIVRRRGTRNTGEFRRWRENDIMRRELEGNRPQADALRVIYFSNWTPLQTTGDANELLAEALKRLAAWIATESNSFDREELRRLEKGLKKLAEEGDTADEGARNAVDVLSRLPNYSTKLLGPLPETPEQAPQDSEQQSQPTESTQAKNPK